jgi:hypothetical protein
MRQAGPVSSEAIQPTAAPSAPSPTDPPAGPAEDVRSAAAELATLAGRPLAEHVEVYEELHRRLHDALRSVDDWLAPYRKFWNQRLDALGTELARGRRRRTPTEER